MAAVTCPDPCHGEEPGLNGLTAVGCVPGYLWVLDEDWREHSNIWCAVCLTRCTVSDVCVLVSILAVHLNFRGGQLSCPCWRFRLCVPMQLRVYGASLACPRQRRHHQSRRCHKPARLERVSCSRRAGAACGQSTSFLERLAVAASTQEKCDASIRGFSRSLWMRRSDVPSLPSHRIDAASRGSTNDMHYKGHGPVLEKCSWLPFCIGCRANGACGERHERGGRSRLGDLRGEVSRLHLSELVAGGHVEKLKVAPCAWRNNGFSVKRSRIEDLGRHPEKGGAVDR